MNGHPLATRTGAFTSLGIASAPGSPMPDQVGGHIEDALQLPSRRDLCLHRSGLSTWTKARASRPRPSGTCAGAHGVRTGSQASGVRMLNGLPSHASGTRKFTSWARRSRLHAQERQPLARVRTRSGLEALISRRRVRTSRSRPPKKWHHVGPVPRGTSFNQGSELRVRNGPHVHLPGSSHQVMTAVQD